MDRAHDKTEFLVQLSNHQLLKKDTCTSASYVPVHCRGQITESSDINDDNELSEEQNCLFTVDVPQRIIETMTMICGRKLSPRKLSESCHSTLTESNTLVYKQVLCSFL